MPGCGWTALGSVTCTGLPTAGGLEREQVCNAWLLWAGNLAIPQPPSSDDAQFTLQDRDGLPAWPPTRTTWSSVAGSLAPGEPAFGLLPQFLPRHGLEPSFWGYWLILPTRGLDMFSHHAFVFNFPVCHSGLFLSIFIYKVNKKKFI